MRQNKGIIYKICYMYAANEFDRQDLYQEILSRVWQGFPKFRGDAKFSTWLYRVAFNTALTSSRQDKRSVVGYTADGTLPDLAHTDADQAHKEQLEMLYNAIGQLNEIEKAVVMLYIDNKSYEEMETIMGIPNGALRVKMTRIKEKLKKITKTN
ncbi:MAG: sigma-70 family RNA polymerase sigma factor [Mucilaginibacter sp.]